MGCLRNYLPPVIAPHSAGQQQLLKTLAVVGHGQIVEQAVGRLSVRADRPQPGQLLGGIAVTRTGHPVKAEVANLADGDRFGLERIEHGDQIEFLAQGRDELGIPLAARFPAHVELPALGVLEEAPQVGDVFFRRAETLRALEEHQPCTERPGHVESFVPGPANRRVEPEVTAVFAIARAETRAFVGWAGRAMGDDLPRLDGELKIRRRRGAPAGGGFDLGQLIKAGVDLHACESLEILLLRRRKATATDLHMRTLGGHGGGC